MEERTLLATMLWANDASGDWDVASNWVNQANPSDQHVPTSSDNAEISFSGVTVTHTSSTSDSVNSLTTASGTTLSLSNGTLSIAAASTISGNLSIAGATLAGAGTATLAGSTTLNGATIDAPLVNQGTILVQNSSSTMAGGLSNAGTITVASGGTLAINAGTFTNFSNGTLTAGTYNIAGTLQFPNAAITTDAANIILNGASSQILDQNGNDALASLADISAGGIFTIENGCNLTAALGLSNAGNITIGAGSTLTGNLYQVGGQTSVLGTLNGVSSPATPPDPGSALAFNGVSDYATVPDQPSLRLTSTVTIEFWAKRERFGLDIVLEKGGDWTREQTDYGVGFNSVDNDMFYFYYAGGWRGTSGVTDFGWHYYAVVATQGAANPQLYIDGVAEPVQYSGGSSTIDLNPATTPLYLGAQIDPVYTYYGETVLDDVSIWNTALSQSAIQADMNQTLTGSESGLVGSWLFNEGAGGVAHDQTANHNDASLGGGNAADAPLWVPSGPFGVDIAGGTLTGAGTINASVLNEGTIALNPGILNITGNYTQAATGALDVGVGGLSPGSQFGQLNVTGQAALNGALNISLLDGYSPPSGDSYPILTFGSRTGDFAVETGLYLGGGEGFSPTYDSSGLNLVVIPEQLGTTTAITSSLEPSTYGQAVTFTATVSPTLSTSFTPTGTVTFYDNASPLGTVTLSSRTASFTTSILVAGSHSIIAQYSGDSNFSGSNSTSLAQAVNQDGSGNVVVSSLNPSTYGQSVTFTATVAAAVPGSGTPTGTVTFYDNSTAIDTATLSNGSATFSTSSLAVGGHAITATYGGDADFTGSSSPALTQTVQQSPTAILDGEVYNDLNGDGLLENGEPGLSGWTVQLLDSSNTMVASTTTDSSGDYSFTGVVSGSYTVAPVAPAGYVPTGPTSGTLAVTATAGQTINNLNFGEFQTVNISGEVFDDLSNSGSFNTNDPGLSAGRLISQMLPAGSLAPPPPTPTETIRSRG